MSNNNILGLGQDLRWEITKKPLLPIINAEGHILASDVDVTSRNVAFGRWAIPKLVKVKLNSFF